MNDEGDLNWSASEGKDLLLCLRCGAIMNHECGRQYTRSAMEIRLSPHRVVHRQDFCPNPMPPCCSLPLPSLIRLSLAGVKIAIRSLSVCTFSPTNHFLQLDDDLISKHEGHLATSCSFNRIGRKSQILPQYNTCFAFQYELPHLSA